MIILHSEAVVKCQSLINLGAFLCIFPVGYFNRVSEVNQNLVKNELFASDLKDLILLSELLLINDRLSNLLKIDIINIAIYLDLKIQEFSYIKKSCGRYL